jgi:hypothetical protein
MVAIGAWLEPAVRLPPLDANAERLANQRALQLLLRLLSPAQRGCFEQRQYFYAEGKDVAHLCILPLSYFNVLDTRTGETLCALPRGRLPLADVMLAQKLILEHEPRAFFRIANRRRELDPKAVQEAERPMWVLRARCEPCGPLRFPCL